MKTVVFDQFSGTVMFKGEMDVIAVGGTVRVDDSGHEYKATFAKINGEGDPDKVFQIVHVRPAVAAPAELFEMPKEEPKDQPAPDA